MMSTETASQSRRLQMVLAGVTGGLVGGIFFGFLMFMLGTLPMVAQLVGSQSVGVGVIVHMLISSVFGAAFGVLIEFWRVNLAQSALLGLAYGVFWWVLGGLILMPLLLGMSPQLSAAFATSNLWSLLGHLVYGLITGITVAVMVLSKNLDFWG